MNLKRNPTCDYYLGALHASFHSVFAYKNSSLFLIRNFCRHCLKFKEKTQYFLGDLRVQGMHQCEASSHPVAEAYSLTFAVLLRQRLFSTPNYVIATDCLKAVILSISSNLGVKHLKDLFFPEKILISPPLIALSFTHSSQ